VFLLAQRHTALQDRRLAEDLAQRTPHVVVVGPKGWDGGHPVAEVEEITYPAALDDLWAGPLVTVPLQAFAWWWAMASGRDPDHPTNLTPVVELDA
jgi:glucosamine 6-phosphate synthetase-like amidotransferase/phosphosugar isomerase protein